MFYLIGVYFTKNLSSIKQMVYVKNFSVEGTKIPNLPIPFGKYKLASEGFIQDNGKWQKAIITDIYVEVYEA